METETTIKTPARSLLDPIPRSSRRVLGMTRDVRPDDEEAPLPGTLRHYRQLMRREYRDLPIPTLGDVISGAWGYQTCPDDATRIEIGRALTRTMTGISGSVGGFAIAPGMSEDIWDRARNVVGPWSMCHWEPVTNRETWLPISGEASSATDIHATWGYSETALPPAVDGRLGQIQSRQNRLLIYSVISRDLLSDSLSIGRWLKYKGLSRIRYAIEWAMILGNGGGAGFPCPAGVANAPSTVVVPRAAGNQIAVADVNAMWEGIAPACQPNAVWHASATAIKYLNGLNASGQFPVGLYFPAGTSPVGSPYGTLFGRPIIPSEVSPSLGSPGDLICVDWTQYVLTYLRLNAMDSPLSFAFQPPRDDFHRGLVGMPEDAVEARASDQNQFSTDVVALVFKFRGDGNFIWPSTMTDEAGNKIGPAAILSS